MKEIKVTEKRYVCDNCGGKHKSQDKIFKDDLEEKEICSSCAKKIFLKDLDIYINARGFYTTCEVSDSNIQLYNYIQSSLLTSLDEKLKTLKKSLVEDTLDVFIKENNIDTKEFFYYY